LSINTFVLTTVGLTPAALLFHRDIRTPFLAQLPIRPQTSDITLSELVDTVRQTDQLLDENTQKSFQQADQRYRNKATTPTYTMGDRVLLYDEYVPSGQMRKLHKFYRPVIVVECLPHWCYRLRDEKQDVFFLLKFTPLV